MTTETGFTPIAVQKNTPKYNGLSIIVASAFQGFGYPVFVTYQR